MDYRDERDALRGRVDNLEQELGDARRELDAHHSDDRQARIAQIEAQMGDAQRLLGRLGDELAELKGRPPPRRAAGPVLAGVVFAVAVAGGVGFALMSRHAHVPPVPIQVREPQPIQPAAVPPQADPTPPPAQTAPPPAPVEEAPTAHATWTARITHGTGGAPPAGTACTVEAVLRGGDGKVHVNELVVTCGGRVLYRSTDKLNGMSMSSSGAEESAGRAAGTEVYRLGFEDKGSRTGERNEISLDTGVGAGAVWRTSVPAFHVDLSVARQSSPVRGPALAP